MSDDRFDGSTSARRLFFATTIAGLSLSSLLLLATACTLERETIFDRVIHLEGSAITQIPATPRLEDELGIEGRRVHVGDAELWVEEEGSGTSIVLINGGPGGTHHQFHPWFGRAAEFARVIYYDQRGTGLSDYEPGPDGYSVDQAIRDLDALRQVLGIEKMVLAGFSYGGFLAQFYTTHYPENVAGLVLVGSSANIAASTGRSRQGEFVSEEERTKMREARDQLREMAPDSGWTDAELLALIVYNNHINGDWKRQNYYKPSPEGMARIALYEWVQDDNFNSIMNQSKSRVDLTGAFDSNPIPTLIMEGVWDLTWGPEKATAFAANHPNGRLVMFEHAGHSIYNEDPEAFFRTLREFIENLETPDSEALSSYSQELAEWREAWRASPEYTIRALDWGRAASMTIAAEFDPSWVEEVRSPTDYLRLGFALYDARRYDEARSVFVRLKEMATSDEEDEEAALASIWEAHMLDLLGRRSEAVTLYRQVAEMEIEGNWSHGQYGMRYEMTPYCTERLETPFQRIENRER